MARFIAFYKKIPLGTLSRDRDKFRVATLQMDSSDPKKNRPIMEGVLEGAIARFEEAQHVTDWRQVADKYEVFEVDYI